MRIKLLKEWWASCELLLVVVADEATGRCAVRSLRKSTCEVRHFDACHDPADEIVRLLEPLTSELPELGDARMSRTNVASAERPEDLMCHYIEQEVRETRGEGRGGLGYPFSERLKTMNRRVTGLVRCLNQYKTKWLTAHDAFESRMRELTLDVVRRRIKDEARLTQFEHRWAAMKDRTLKKLDEGTFEGAIVPIGFNPAEHEVRVKKKSVEVENQLFNLPALEAPPAAGEAPSSSSEAAPRPPPEAAPVENDTVRTVSAVLSHHVGEARLGVPEWEALAVEFMNVATKEDLRPQDAAAYEKVSLTGLGTCSKCRWGGGCMKCSEKHAWSYYCRMTLWHSIDSTLRPAAKPKGRPRKQ